MRKTKEPFELVIHIDEAGTRATASYRLRVFDDADTIIEGATTMEAVTLTELGAAFPWGEFIDAVTKGALVTVDAEKAKAATANTECTAAKAEATKANKERDAAVAALAAEKAAHP